MARILRLTNPFGKRGVSIANKPSKTQHEMSNLKTRLPQAGRAKGSESCTASAVCPTDSGGDKNPANQKKRSRKELLIATYNIRTMRKEEHFNALEEELKHINWSILGISETRLAGEMTTTLKSGHVLFQRNADTTRIGGVALFIHRDVMKMVTVMRAISDRVIYLVLEPNPKYSIQIIQVYAPTSTYSDGVMEQFYEDVAKAKAEVNTQATIVMGDFNGRIGEGTNADSEFIGLFGLGIRNERGQMLVDFLNRERLYCMSTFFQKPAQRRWTWRSPNGVVRNQIDYIMSSDRRICSDVSVLNSFDTGSDHRMVRAKIAINLRLERKKMVERKLRPTRSDLKAVEEEYQNHLSRKLGSKEEMQRLTPNKLNNKIVRDVHVAVKQTCALRRQTSSKLKPETFALIELRKNTNRDNTEYEQICKRVKKAIRKDVRSYNTKLIEEAIEDNLNMKVLKSKLSRGKGRITCIRNENGTLVYGKQQILKAVQNFYEELYEERVPAPRDQRPRNRMTVLNIGSEEIPEITREELRAAIRELGNRKSPGKDKITAEMIKGGGTALEDALCILYNKCLESGQTPESWQNAEVVILFKKGDPKNIENYRPISLLSILYKLLTRVITKRLTNKFDLYQPAEQAGFRRGYSTIDHIHTMRSLIEKCSEYNVPLCLAFVDYQKAFDSVEIWAVLAALDSARIDSRYRTLIQNIYQNATLQVKINEDWETQQVKVKRGIRQGDTMSPKLFTAALEYAFKGLNWEERGLRIDGQYLNHLRFADDIVIISKSPAELATMLRELNHASRAVGLSMNLAKTKVMGTEGNTILMDNTQIEHVKDYVYLGHKLKLGRENQDAELGRRIGLSWAAFGKMKHILANRKTPINLKRRVYEACVLPVATYGLETITLTQRNAERLRVTQRAMERTMLGIGLRDRMRNEHIRQRSGVTDIMDKTLRLKWRWAGHVARSPEHRWTKILLNWQPRETTRSAGRPQRRWRDDLTRHVGMDWILIAQDREAWRNLEEAFVQEWTVNG